MYELSIIIVNYKSHAFITQCIESALEFESASLFEWIIVDNASGDQSKSILTEKFDFIKWIDMGYNAGFARANNAGINASNANTILLLNPDTIILNDAIYSCLKKFLTSEYAARGVQMLNEDLSKQISGSKFMYGGINHLLPIPYWGSFLKLLAGLFNISKPGIESAAEEEQVDWISGAFLMVKKEVIEKAGLMDNDFFLYAEEVEWCSRIGKQGKLCIYGEFNIIHIMGEIIQSNTNSKSKSYSHLVDKKGLQLIVSNHLRIRKQYGIFWTLFQLSNFSIGVPVILLCLFVESLIKYKSKKLTLNFNNWVSYTKNVVKLWTIIPQIIICESKLYRVI
jgi:GT2 family glycosyltransferase